MTVDVHAHVSRSKNLILNDTRSTDVNTKYQQLAVYILGFVQDK